VIAVSDIAFGIGMIAAVIAATIIYVAVEDRPITAPDATPRSHVTVVERPHILDWADDPEWNPDLTPPRGQPRPSLDRWVRQQLAG